MSHAIKTVRVKPGSELDRLLAEVGDGALELERAGVRYRVSRLDTRPEIEIWANYEPEIALAGMRRAAGSWRDIDADALKDNLYRARERGSRPPDRP